VRCSLPPAYLLISRCALQLFPDASQQFADNAVSPAERLSSELRLNPYDLQGTGPSSAFAILTKTRSTFPTTLKDAPDLHIPIAQNALAQAGIRTCSLLRSQQSIKKYRMRVTD
jgi:hypothetical protein